MPHAASRHLLGRVLTRDAGQGRDRDRSRRRLRERVFERGRKDRSRGVVVTHGRSPDPLVDLPSVVLQQLLRGHAKACGPPTDQPKTSAGGSTVCAWYVMTTSCVTTSCNSAAGVEVRNARSSAQILNSMASVRQLVLCSRGCRKGTQNAYGKASDMAQGSHGQYSLRLRLTREPCAVQCRVEGAVTRLVNGLGLGLGWVFRATVQCREERAVARLVRVRLGLGWVLRVRVSVREGAVARLAGEEQPRHAI